MWNVIGPYFGKTFFKGFLYITPAIKQSKKMVLKNWTLAFAGVTDYV
jgi:hypothetical protein